MFPLPSRLQCSRLFWAQRWDDAQNCPGPLSEGSIPFRITLVILFDGPFHSRTTQSLAVTLASVKVRPATVMKHAEQAPLSPSAVSTSRSESSRAYSRKWPRRSEMKHCYSPKVFDSAEEFLPVVYSSPYSLRISGITGITTCQSGEPLKHPLNLHLHPILIHIFRECLSYSAL